MNAERHLYLDSTGKRLVPENHPDAAELLAPTGQPIPEKRLRAAGLTLDDVREHVDSAKPYDAEDESDHYAVLMKLKREELNARATEAGVDKPEVLANKEAVVTAILAAQGPGE